VVLITFDSPSQPCGDTFEEYSMLCTNGHNNATTASYCAFCGINTFQPMTLSGADSTSFNGLAIASMVLGIVWIYWIGSILALIFGYIARRNIRTNGQKGDGMALAGIVLGWVGVGFLAIAVVVFIIGVSQR
jgi:hypothetical protein